MQSKDDLTPKAFKPLNDFVLKEAPESVSSPPSTCSNFVLFRFRILESPIASISSSVALVW